jgi:hypothetical protein
MTELKNELQKIKNEIEEIKKRNISVENDKAWETSIARRVLLMLFTFLAIGAYMYTIGINRPLLNAIVPTTGFMLSTLTLPFFKSLWLKSKK